MPPILERVLAMANGEDFPVVTESRERQVLKYFARRIETKQDQNHWTHKHVLQLHKIVAAGEGMDQGLAGEYRTIAVRIGEFVPPPPDKLPQLMFNLLEWWETKTP